MYLPGLETPDLAGLPADPPTSHWCPRRPVIRNPSSSPALRHDGRPAGVAGSKNAIIDWVKSRSARCWTIWEPTASHGFSARAWVNCRH